ncbi:MAG: DUF983 domain-containing protein [Pseudomonadota bacterium]|nr:DUF983 domain-containing protein [Pseudomonadota bacterium]
MNDSKLRTHHWTSARAPDDRKAMQSILRGLARRCPNCGIGSLFRAFLKPVDHCPHCAEPMHHQRADDAPPYFTMLIVGHLIVPALLSVEMAYAPPIWVHMLIWPTAAVAMSLFLLQPVKGALIGLQWSLRMHGFGGPEAPPETDSFAR